MRGLHRGVVAGLVIGPLLAVPAAHACGDMSVTLQLLQHWPAARGPMVAEIREIRTGGLPEPGWQRGRNGDTVAVRQRRATAVLRALQARLVERGLGDAGASFAVLFLNDHVWSRYELADGAARLRLKGLRPIVPLEGEARVHMSARVVDVLLRGELAVADAEASGVMLVDGEPDAVVATRQLLETAFVPQAGAG